MAKQSPIRAVRGLPTWQSLVCLFLVALVLYNPFITALDSPAGPCVRHAVSNRATVGASELQHFTPAGKSASLLAGDALLLFALFTPGPLYPYGPWAATASVPPAAVQHLAPSLWFRPPPSV